jgi:LacI family transcriptional regulator
MEGIKITLTINDIAEKAGVSRSTVSRVLNNNGYVSDETRKRVEHVIKKHEYLPSATARSLSKKDTNTIGVVIPEADNSFFGEILKGISEVVDQNDMTLIFCDTDNNMEKQEKALKMLRGQRVKGLILTPVNDYSDDESANTLRKQLDSLMVPVVLLDRQVEHSHWDGVYFENFKGAYAGTEVLIKEGYKNIGIITGDLNLKIGRYRGFLQAMEDYEIPILKEYVLEGNFSEERAYELMKKCIENNTIAEAMLTCNNRTTLGFIRALREYEITIGGDIAAIGIDRIKLLDDLGYNFSYVERDTIEMGRTAMYKLLDRFKDPNKKREVVNIPFELTLKGSEKIAPKESK